MECVNWENQEANVSSMEPYLWSNNHQLHDLIGAVFSPRAVLEAPASSDSFTEALSVNLPPLENQVTSFFPGDEYRSMEKARKKPRWEKPELSSTISFRQPNSSLPSSEEPDAEAMAQMKEMIYRAAAFRPVNFGEEAVEKPRRKNVRISSDPQTVAARQRRERISERIRILQRLVPGGSKLDTASMLEEAANYLKFLKSQVLALEKLGHRLAPMNANLTFSQDFSHPFPTHS